MATVIAAVLYTWLYTDAERSVSVAISSHFFADATGQLLELSPEAQGYQTAATLALVAVVVLWWGPVHLRRGNERPLPPP